jgi:hypothetical protein
VNENDKGVGVMLLHRTAVASSRPAWLDGGEGGRQQALLIFGWAKRGGRNAVEEKGGGRAARARGA